MEALMNFLVDYKVAEVAIGCLGLFAFAVIGDRFKALFVDYALPAEPFMKQVTKLMQEDRVEEALTFCAANEKKPLAHVIKRILERSDRDEKAISQSLDIASSEVAPKLVKRLSQVQMVSNVVTLVGLFGTVVGLIVAFKAIGSDSIDPSMKQTLLASGISIAMSATACALLVAIPVMVCYTFLYDKQTKLFAEIDENSQKVVEMLRDRVYMPFKSDGAYPTSLHADKMKTPHAPVKAPKVS
jgi:biopolymer transport protein ExbB/TolQ